MRQPSEEQINIATAWLRDNEGDDGEADACRAVADWIRHLANEAFLRNSARKAGVTVARLKRKLAELA